MINDPHVKLLAKAFGDLDKRPFAWCFESDADIDADVDDEQMTQYDSIAEQVARRQASAAALEEPRAGETYISSWGELLHAMTNGQMGTPPQSLRRYEPQTTEKR